MKLAALVRRAVVGAIMLCFATGARADGLEYRYEVGAMVGACSYYGDANYVSPIDNFNMMGGLLWRYNINPRMAVKADLAVGRISGTTVGKDNVFPGGEVKFGRMLYELGAQYECHFLAYGDGTGYKRSHRIAPYILAGVGMVRIARHLAEFPVLLLVALGKPVRPALGLHAFPHHIQHESHALVEGHRQGGGRRHHHQHHQHANHFPHRCFLH